ncbi:hypothetical protein EVAR_61893_1 [Eumeta japonica]|uniref:Uncharacterized protein n=1 Tax=Eumeta variegata TaxID=151549 RepID=A0A4C1YMB6_EUMVA|nr:hypothetical protein EVAR_61893_1 [Eumeta japonica]
MPEEATATAMSDLARIVAKINDMRNVLPVPPGASRKNKPFPSSTAFINVPWTTLSLLGIQQSCNFLQYGNAFTPGLQLDIYLEALTLNGLAINDKGSNQKFYIKNKPETAFEKNVYLLFQNLELDD